MDTNYGTINRDEKPEPRVPETGAPDKAAYMERIEGLPAEDKAFLDGYLFAIMKNKKGA